jgi:dihydrofolate synthase/folylpolyglutamate synthase
VTYQEAIAWLYARQMHGIRLELETMTQLCGALGIPIDPSCGAPCFIHVAGTNGKGSVCAFLDAACAAANLPCGLYTSPHLVSFRERIRIGGRMISEERTAQGLSRIRLAADQSDLPVTFFEVATALAFDWFAECGVPAAVVETGLGGRLDATNVILPEATVITPIGLDHQTYLGHSLSLIAGEKAGILKPGVPLVMAPQPEEAGAVIERAAARVGAPLHRVEQPWTGGPLGLAGPHQSWNAAVARAALAAAPRFAGKVCDAAIARGFAHTIWPGRFQIVNERIVLDGAHNPAAAEVLAEAWRAKFGSRKATLILGLMRDKDAAGVIAAVAPVASRILAVRVQNPRSHSAEDLAALSRNSAPGVPCEAAASAADALEKALRGADPILVGGSLFLVGEMLCALGLAEDKAQPADH